MKSNIILAILGILVCTTSFAADKPIVLTEKNHVLLSGPVTDKSVAEVQASLGKVAASAPTGSIVYLVLDTPGGSVLAGNQLADFGKSLRVSIKPICLFCASMGYHLFQSFDERLVQSSSILMSHRASLGGVEGQIPGELLTRVKFYTDLTHEMDVKVAKRVGLSTEAYKALIYDELWLTGEQAVATKHADKIVKIVCEEKLLKEFRHEMVNTIFGPVEITMSRCPLITGILSYQFKRIVKEPKSDKDVMTAIKKVKRTTIKEWF